MKVAAMQPKALFPRIFSRWTVTCGAVQTSATALKKSAAILEKMLRYAALVSLVLLLAVNTGCGSSEAKPEAGCSADSWDLWEVISMCGSRVGYRHYAAESITENGKTFTRYSSTEKVTLMRSGQTLIHKTAMESVIDRDGNLVRFQSTSCTGDGQGAMTVSGYYDHQAGKLQITTKSFGKSITSAIDWKPRWAGLFVVERSLREKPMKPGERRTVWGLNGMTYRVSKTELEAIAEEPTPIPAATKTEKKTETKAETKTETKKLLKVKVVTQVSQQKIELFVWVDAKGVIWKTKMPLLKFESYCATKEIALQSPEAVKADLFGNTTVRIAKQLRNPYQTRKVVYLARLKGSDPTKVFATGPSQQVRRIDASTVEITVRAIRPNQPEKLTEKAADPPTEKDLAPNNLIQSDDKQVIALAKGTVTKETDPWRIAVALEHKVFRLIRKKNYSQVITSAAEVARNHEGDCTEHAVLLAAMCRARKIPARIVIGLVYARALHGYGYHMWTEVWITDRWVPLDATLGRGGIGATHIKLGTSNLAGVEASSAFLPVIKVIGNLKLEIKKVE